MTTNPELNNALEKLNDNPEYKEQVKRILNWQVEPDKKIEGLNDIISAHKLTGNEKAEVLDIINILSGNGELVSLSNDVIDLPEETIPGIRNTSAFINLLRMVIADHSANVRSRREYKSIVVSAVKLAESILVSDANKMRKQAIKDGREVKDLLAYVNLMEVDRVSDEELKSRDAAKFNPDVFNALVGLLHFL